METILIAYLTKAIPAFGGLLAVLEAAVAAGGPVGEAAAAILAKLGAPLTAADAEALGAALPAELVYNILQGHFAGTEHSGDAA